MTRININSMKASVVFRQGALPAIDPNKPEFVLALGNKNVLCKVNAKAARKLAAHTGGAVLQGRLVVDNGGSLVLLDAGFQWIEYKPVEQPEAPAEAQA